MLTQLRLTLSCCAKTDLHLGTGRTVKLSELRPGTNSGPAGEQQDDPEVMIIARNVDDQPYIPATALKSAFRRRHHAYFEADKDERDEIFGTIKQTTSDYVDNREVLYDEGQIGAVLWGDFTLTAGPNTGGELLPLYRKDTHSWIATRNRISRHTGAVDRNFLFNREFLLKGSQFTGELIYIGDEARGKQVLEKLLGAVTEGDALTVGQGGRVEQGQLNKFEIISATLRRFDPVKKATVENSVALQLRAPATQPSAPPPYVLRLEGTSPFLVSDPYSGDDNEIMALRRDDDRPTLPNTSLLGALRSRAVWLAASEAEDSLNYRDDLALAPSRWKTPKDLSVTERLFGVPGWRGLVYVSENTCKTGTLMSMPGITIDRFTGGTIDGALFFTSGYCDTRFKITLNLDRRGDWPSAEDTAFFERLLNELSEDGIELGHGTNKGFGWFEVEVTK